MWTTLRVASRAAIAERFDVPHAEERTGSLVKIEVTHNVPDYPHVLCDRYLCNKDV